MAQEPPIILAEKAIIQAPDHIQAHRIIPQKRQVKGIIDFYIGDVKTEGDRLIAFKISKKHLRPKGTFSKRKFGEELEDHFPASIVLWSAESQMIFIEKPKKDQMSVISIINNLQAYLNGRLLSHGFVVLIAPLQYKSSFWEVIDKYDIKYSVEFTLFAPNFLDATSSARDIVECNKKDYNANKTSFKLENDEGNLQIQKDDNFIGSLLAWIVAGAGKWVAEVGTESGKKSISSETNSRTLDRNLSKYEVETAKEFTDKAVESIRKEDALE